MLSRKLAALNHPTPETFNVHDEAEFRSAVLWLEDQKIRQYKIDEREALRKINEPEWAAAFVKYQADLNSPVIKESAPEQLTWLASYAIRLEYADNAAKYNAAIAEKCQKQSSIPNVVSSNPLDKLDFSSGEFSSGVAELASLGCVGPHPDARVRLSALAQVLKTAPHPVPASSASAVEQVHAPSDVLKLLFISELRNLQTSINEALVAVQSITADPRTDTTLGKVGF